MAELVLIFDFDKTIIDVDSDNLVVDQLGSTHFFNHLLPSLPWNSLMDRMMMELHSRGKTIRDIADCLKLAPLHPRILSAIQSAHASGCDLRIVSDANVFFIETILRHHGVLDCFSEITTNPSSVDGHFRLRILPYHDFNLSPHHCTICPPNMCKGLVMEEIQARLSDEGKKRIVYVGDGRPDFCAGLKLSKADFLMPKMNFPIWEAIRKNPNLVKAKICEWRDGEEFESKLLQLITEEKNCSATRPVPSLACKFHTTSSISPHNDFPNPLRVPL